MTVFLQALYNLKKGKRKKVRIGYFGDSMIEGDLITQDIRGKFQDVFGGSGVGFVPITSIVAQFRQTISHQFSDDWREINYMNRLTGVNLGISGHTFYPSCSSNVVLSARNIKHLNRFEQLSLLYGQSDATFSVSFNNNEYTLKSNNSFNSQLLTKDSLTKIANIEFCGNNAPLYGFSVEGKEGIILDNFSFRGTSGTELIRLNKKMLYEIDSLRHYDLIILHYGPNLLYDASIIDFSWYYKQMTKTLQFLKRAFPNTSFLIVSSADKALWVNGKYETAPGVEPLIKTQKKLAIENGCAFYNLYNAMGGYNSMVTWAEKKPILAGKDYTHFNLSGASKIGKMITHALLLEYDGYEKNENLLAKKITNK